MGVRLLWPLAGFAAGVVVSRNAEAMSAPSFGAVVIGCLLFALLTWWGGKRTTAVSVATAVAEARAEAAASAEAQAAAIAQAAVHLHLTQLGTSVAPGAVAAVADEAQPSDALTAPTDPLTVPLRFLEVQS